MTSIKEQTDAGLICILGCGSLQPKSILYCSESYLRKWVAKDKDSDYRFLLYYRHFATIFDALAHKLMLENLCDASLNCVISRMNPGWEDLRENLWEDLAIHVNDESE